MNPGALVSVVWLWWFLGAGGGAAPPGQGYALPNGLRVVLAPDPRFGYVTVLGRHRAGARQEPAGRAGLAPVVAQLVGGARLPPACHRRPPSPGPDWWSFLEMGFEQTDYLTTTTAAGLRDALCGESWRTTSAGQAFAQGPLLAAVEATRNRRRSWFEASPYGATGHMLWQALFPADHPLRAERLGAPEDLEAITLDDVRRFHQAWYRAASTTLVVTGTFEVEAARRWIEELFGPLAGDPAPALRPAAPRSLAAEEVVQTREMLGGLPRLAIAWPTPGSAAEEHAAGEVAAEIIGGLRASRVMKALPQAIAVTAWQVSLKEGSVLRLSVDLPPDVPFELARRRVDLVLQVLREHGPTTEEVERAVRSIVRRTVLEGDDPPRRARHLAAIVDDGGEAAWGAPLSYEESGYLAVTPARVQEFVAHHLGVGRVVLQASVQEGH
jgi:zinc protease